VADGAPAAGESRAGESVSAPAARRWARALAVTLALAGAARIVATYSAFDHTWDEPYHLAGGMELLDQGQYRYALEHPPLARVSIALGPFLDGERSHGEKGSWLEGLAILYESGHYERTLSLARLGVLPYFLLALWAAWLWTRWLLGEVASVVAVFLLVTLPPLLGNSGVATTDGPLVGTGGLALYMMARWLETPTLRRGALLGLTTALAVVTKFSAIPFLGAAFAAMALVRWLLSKPRWSLRPLAARGAWGGLIIGVVLALATLWLSYGCGRVPLRPRPRPPAGQTAGKSSAASAPRWVDQLLQRRIWPRFMRDVPRGIREVVNHNRWGHRSYLLGEIRSEGWWYYFPVVLGVKTPVPLLLLGVLGLGLASWRAVRTGDWRLAAPAAAAFAILAFVMTSRINIGVRHVLILYPLLAICGAWAAVTGLRMARESRWSRIVGAGVVGLLLWQGAESVWVHPDYLAYFNPLAGPHPENVLMPADLDWGQDLKRLGAEVRRRGIREIHVAYNGRADLPRHVPGAVVLPARRPVTGWVAISLWSLTSKGDAYAWLRAYRPVARVGRSIDLYEIAPETP